MGDSQYWESLWGVGIIIFLCLLIIFLGAGIFIVLYDHISEWRIWDSPIWLTLKIPFIIIGVIGFVAGVIALARYQGQKELKAVQEYAQGQGWSFSRDDAQGFKERVASIWWDLSCDLYHIRTVESGQRRLYLFDCSYKHKEAAGRTSYSSGTAGLVQSDRFRAVTVPVEIVSRDWTEVMMSNKVDMGQSPFAEKFLVLSNDPRRASPESTGGKR